jgi:hypothetical protein
VYYGGSATPHLGWKRSGSLCLASIPEDGFAFYSRQDAAKPATVRTAVLRADHGEPVVRSEGMVKVEREVLDEGAFRLKITLGPDAKVYSIRGARLLDETWKPKPEPPWKAMPVRRGALKVSFSEGDQGWKGVDALEHIPSERCVRVARGKGLRPIASGQPLAGSWPVEFGGNGLLMRARLRASEGRAVARFEVFAKDVAQWFYETREPLGQDWNWFEAPLQFGWTDAEAVAAGWVRGPQSFGWRETLQNAGKVVVMQGTAQGGAAFDLAEFELVPR